MIGDDMYACMWRDGKSSRKKRKEEKSRSGVLTSPTIDNSMVRAQHELEEFRDGPRYYALPPGQHLLP